MSRILFRNVSWLGSIGLMFVLMAVPGAVAQGSKDKAAKAAAQTAATAAKIDINNATEKQLIELPGVGKATADKIIAGRPFASVDDLAKAGVSKSTIAKIAPLVTVGAAATAAPSAPAATAKTAAKAATTAAKTSAAGSTAFTPPPAPGMVWVNLETKVYHKEGDRWYGKTKNGKYMTEADAIKAGYRLAKQE